MIREIIIAKLRDKEITAGAIASKSGLPRSSVWRFIRWKRDISGERAARLLHSLGVRVGGRIATDLRKTISQKLANSGSSHRSFGQQIGVPGTVISDYVAGRRDSATEIIDKIMIGLKINLVPVSAVKPKPKSKAKKQKRR